MSSAVQGELFGNKWEVAFRAWITTPAGRRAAYLFIKLACGAKARGARVGAKEVWERLRWHYSMLRTAGEEFALNNNFTAYMARYAADKVPELKDFFEFRRVKG